MVTYNFIDVHERIINLLITMYLSILFKCLLIQVSHKVVDTIVIVDEKKIFELRLIYWDDNFFLDNDFFLLDCTNLINNCDFYFFALQTDMQVSFNVEEALKLIPHYIHFIIVNLLFPKCEIWHSERY